MTVLRGPSGLRVLKGRKDPRDRRAIQGRKVPKVYRDHRVSMGGRFCMEGEPRRTPWAWKGNSTLIRPTMIFTDPRQATAGRRVFH